MSSPREKYKNRVLIEAKRNGTLDKKAKSAEEQSLNYALYLGTPLVVITDGIEWLFYLPIPGGIRLEERLFQSVNILDLDSSESAAALYRFLSRDQVITGKAQKEADEELSRQHLERNMHFILKEIWEQALKEPDIRMVNLITEKIEENEEYGFGLVDMEAISKFLRMRAGLTEEEAGQIDKPAKEEISEQGLELAGKENARTRKVIPVAFQLDGVRHELSKLQWNEVLIQLCGLLNKEYDSVFEERVLGLRCSKYPQFSKSKEELSNPLSIPGSPVYVEGQALGAKTVEIRARKVLHKVRGSDGGFRIETEEAPEEL